MIGAREPLFCVADRMFEHPSENKFIIILADSGMGKTSFLLNYYAYHWRLSRRRRRFSLALVPLSLKNSDEVIKNLPDKSSTILFLDALDEDAAAIVDHKARIERLIEGAAAFRCVAITCRTQFFSKDEELPADTGLLRIAPVKARSGRSHQFHKLYIAPFTDDQISRYLRLKFPLMRYRARAAAWNLVRKVTDLIARPMLLAHIDDLVHQGFEAEYSFQLYEEMVCAWLERERGFVNDIVALRAFCEYVALDIFNNRRARGTERINSADLQPIAVSHGIRLQDWQLRGRSLLNRDATGNYKFAHRSFMEYLCVMSFAKGAALAESEPWTDVMKSFLLELLAYGGRRGEGNQFQYGIDFTHITLRGADLGGADLRGKRLDSVDMQGLDLRRSSLAGARFAGANLAHTDLRDVELTECNFERANLTGANLAAQNVRGCSFSRASLSGANLESAVMDDVDLSGADLREARLKGAVLRGANLTDANFADQQLAEVNFSDARLQGVNLTNASLSAAVFSGVDFYAVDLHSSELRRAIFQHTALEGKDFTGKDLSEMDLTSANLRNVDLTGAHLEGSNLTDADLSNSRAIGTRFGTCCLRGTILRGAVLSGAEMSSVRELTQAQLDGAFGDETTVLPGNVGRPGNWTPGRTSSKEKGIAKRSGQA